MLDHNTSIPLMLINVGGVDGVVGHDLVHFLSWPTPCKLNNGENDYIEFSTYKSIVCYFLKASSLNAIGA